MAITKDFTIISLTPCRTCMGSGIYTRKPMNLAERCTTCQGTGKLRVTKVVHMTIEPAGTDQTK